MKQILSFFLFIGLTINVFAQVPITIGTASVTNSGMEHSPINIYYKSGHCQILYTASEINAAGWSGAGVIQALAFNIYATPDEALPNFTIKLKNTTNTDVLTYESSGLTTVYSNPSYQPIAGVFDILPLSTGFTWDGTSNLLVDVCFDQVANYSSSGQLYMYENNPNEYRYIRADNAPQCAVATTDNLNNNKPQIQLQFQSTTPCSGTPNAGNAISSVSNFCANTPFNLSLTNNTVDQGISYQWQSSPDGSSWTNLGTSQNFSSLSTNTNASTYYQCVVTCSNSALSSTSTPVFVTLNPPLACYCTPNYTLDCSNDYISNFSISNINTPVVCSPTGIIDSTSSTTSIIDIAGGQTYTLSATVNTSGSNGDGVFGAWIDYNQNYTFDSNEYIKLGYGGSGTYTAIVNAPLTITNGAVRMRLMADVNHAYSNTMQSACVNINFTFAGQIIDYQVNLIQATPCSGTPNAGNAVATSTLVCPIDTVDLSIQNQDVISGATYQWQSSTDLVSWINIGAIQSEIAYTVGNQLVTTHYRCVVTCTSSATSSTSTPITVTQKPATSCYCVPEDLNCSNSQITNVLFETLNDNPTCSGNGYSDNTALPAVNLNANQSYTISCNTNSTFSDYMSISSWIDFNQNGIFESIEETAIGTSTTGILTQTINIPYTALAGNTRMRIKMLANYMPITSISPCSSTYYDGQVLDYMVNITAVAPCSGTPNGGNATSTNTRVCSSNTFTLDLTGNSIASNITYQWQASSDNINWTNLGAPQSVVPYIVTNQLAETYYRCLLTCNSTSLTASSTSIKVEQTSLALCHCIPVQTECNSSYISNVAINTLSNTSTCSSSNGYTDYTTNSAITTTLTIGQAYTATITLSNQFYGNVSAWIDYNQDGSFDASEYTYLGDPGGSPVGNYTVSNNISIPANALQGITTLRIRNIENITLGDGDACFSPVYGDPGSEYYEYGESEDYLITLVAPDCSTLNYPPTAILSGNTELCSGQSSSLTINPSINTGAGLTYQWYSTESGAWSTYGSTVTVGSIAVTPTVSSSYYVEVACHGTLMVATDTILVNYHPINISPISTSPTCSGDCNGSITLNAIAPGATSMDYSWSPSVSTGDIASNICAGTYTVNISSSFGCSNTFTYTLNEPSQLLNSIGGNTLVCLNSNSTYSSSVSGGVTPYNYAWATSTNTLASTTANYDYVSSTTGNNAVWLTVTDANGCSVVSNTISTTTPPSTSISGTVTTYPATAVAGRVVLFQYLPFYTKFDSVAGQNLGANGDYNFASFDAGTYIVKAIPAASNLQVAYGDSALMWKDAKHIIHDCIANDVQNINVKALSTFSTTGSGSLSGMIYEGQGYGQRTNSVNQTAAPGQPIGGIIVKGGRNPGGQMFVQTITSSNGTYTLSGLPDNAFGESYFVMVDIPGLDTNNTYHKVITVTNSNYTNLDFVVDSAKVTPVNAVGVRNIQFAENKVVIYPNPTNQLINIKYTLTHSSTIQVELCDMLGKVVKQLMPSSYQHEGTYVKSWDMNEINNGMYFIKLTIDDKESSTKISVIK